MFVAWTTLDDRTIAEQLAVEAVTKRLAVCVQVDPAPILSVYRWKEEVQTAQEYRIAFKCLAPQLVALESWVLSRHPYETPEWIVVRAEHVGEKYLSWARASSSTPPL